MRRININYTMIVNEDRDIWRTEKKLPLTYAFV